MPAAASQSSTQARREAQFESLELQIGNVAKTVDSLVNTISADRAQRHELDREIFDQIGKAKEAAGNANRISWPSIVATFSAMIGFAAIVGGLGHFALNSQKEISKVRADANKEISMIHRQMLSKELDSFKQSTEDELAARRPFMDEQTKSVSGMEEAIKNIEKRLSDVDNYGSRKWNEGAIDKGAD